jgi:hypothetical protein
MVAQWLQRCNGNDNDNGYNDYGYGNDDSYGYSD